jgi:hypothetical protein
MSNETLLDIIEQPPIEYIMRRNRLRWFGHINRAVNSVGSPSLIKKVMFAYFHDEKRPSNIGRSKRWEDKVLKDIDKLHIGIWRRIMLGRKR